MAHVALDDARPEGSRSSEGWYRQVTPAQWKAFSGAYLAWVLDGFDFTILTFLLVDIRRSFTVDAALAGLLGTITLIFRVAGGIGAGTAADRWGRKGPLMFSIVWYSLFSFLGGFRRRTGCCSRFAPCSASAWVACGPRACRSHWSTGRHACAAPRRG